jgi:hypothetical protein
MTCPPDFDAEFFNHLNHEDGFVSVDPNGARSIYDAC